MSSIAIVYLDRWGNQPRFADAFLNSLTANPAGTSYDVIWQLKGYPEDTHNPRVAQFRQDFSGEVIEARYPDHLYQFNLAFDAARRFEYEFLVFFVSWSRILAPDWLKLYCAALTRQANCGVVGATGSYECVSAEQAFPNPHVRTNAFMIERKLLLSLDPGPLEFEGGGKPVRSRPQRPDPPA